MSFDPLNERYKDLNTIYERNLIFWIWLWLPIYALFRLAPEVYAKVKEERAKKKSET